MTNPYHPARQKKKPKRPTGLYWSLHGEVACADHAPRVEDPRWKLEGWTPWGLSAQLRGSTLAVLTVPLWLTFLSSHYAPVLNNSQHFMGRASRILGGHAVERRVHRSSTASTGPGRRTNAAAHHTLGRQACQEVSTRTRSGL